MRLSDLVFTGFNKRVAAVHRDSGQLLWQWKAPQSGYVTLLLNGDRLIVSVNGYLHALDALTGRLLWSNDLPGFGVGVASLASVRGGSSVPMPAFSASADSESAAMANQQFNAAG
jgi:outer membrane protein assembly factor BamB